MYSASYQPHNRDPDQAKIMSFTLFMMAFAPPQS